MVKFIRSLFVLASIAAVVVGCENPEFHFYTRSLANGADGWVSADIPKEIFNGTYQRLNGYDGTPEAKLTFNTNRCKSLGFDLISEIDTDSRCKPDDDSEVIKMNKIVYVRDGNNKNRLFVEAKVKTGFLQSRFALYELVVTQDKFVLIQMIYDTDKLMKSGLNFSKTQTGSAQIYEVQNQSHHVVRLIDAMKHTSRYRAIHFKPETEEQNRKLREALKFEYFSISEQKFPFVNEKSCEEATTGFSVNGSGKPYGHSPGIVKDFVI